MCSSCVQLSAGELKQQRQAVLNARNAVSYLKRFSMIAADYTPETELKNIAVRQGWLKSE